MALTAHKTVTMFMRYVHTEDDPVRNAADLVAARRKGLVEEGRTAATVSAPSSGGIEVQAAAIGVGSKTSAGVYRPFRHRLTGERAVPPGTKRTEAQAGTGGA